MKISHPWTGLFGAQQHESLLMINTINYIMENIPSIKSIRPILGNVKTRRMWSVDDKPIREDNKLIPENRAIDAALNWYKYLFKLLVW